MPQTSVNSSDEEKLSNLDRLILEHAKIKQQIVDILSGSQDVTQNQIQDLDSALSRTCDQILTMELSTDEEHIDRMKFIISEIHEICEDSALARHYTSSLLQDANKLAK